MALLAMLFCVGKTRRHCAGEVCRLQKSVLAHPKETKVKERGEKTMNHLNREELLLLLGAARKHSERDWLLLLTTFWHGLRASEATGSKTEQIRDGFIVVQRLKGSLKTRQPLLAHPDPLLDEKTALESLAADLPAKTRVFQVSRVQFFRLMRKYGAEAGLPRHVCHPHVLKHSIAMQTIRSAGIENVRQYLGHKSIASTGSYLKVSDEQASMAVQSVF
jgi:type 1 fimbriae regulatory protein FimB